MKILLMFFNAKKIILNSLNKFKNTKILIDLSTTKGFVNSNNIERFSCCPAIL